jgi:hypothetical protein
LKKKLLLLDLVLAALAVVLALRLRDQWLEARKREQVVLGQRVRQLPAPPYSRLPAVQPVSAATYADIAQKNLFSLDRNPTVIVAVAPPKPMPELPVFFGAMNLGDGPVAMMSVKSGETQQPIRYGEKIGEFVLVAVNREEIILEWDGKKITKKPSELRPKIAASNPPAGAAAAAQPGAAASSGAQATSLNVSSKPVEAAPGQDTGGGFRACLAGDNSPAGTVRDGMRKVMTPTPFGSRVMCRWEPVK